MRERYAEREKQYMIETLMKKKNVSQKQLEEHFKRIEGKNNADDDMSNIRFEADETYRDIVNKLLDSEMHTAEKYASQNSFFLILSTCITVNKKKSIFKVNIQIKKKGIKYKMHRYLYYIILVQNYLMK